MPKIKNTNNEYHLKPVKSGALEGQAVSAPHVVPVVLLLLQIRCQFMNEESTGL